MAYTYLRRKTNQKNKIEGTGPKKEKKPQLPNSLIMRVMEEPEAEKEADRLSQGITSSTPEDVMREMGGRLGADFSSVNFHSDSVSMNKSQALGARAWAQGRDVYFGKGGFDPSVAAHELVHTVQQGAVHGNVSQSMAMGAVQMKPEKGENADDEVIKPNHAMKDEQIIHSLTLIFKSDMGARVYKRLEKTLKEMIKKGAGKNHPYTKEKGIEFLSLAAARDYGAKGILSTIMQKDISDKDAAKDAAFEYEELIKFLSQRLGAYGLEDIAIQTQLINRPPKYEHVNKDHKRAYETDMPADAKDGNVFNPNNIPELTRIQDEIDNAGDAKTAYGIFAAYTGNPAGKYTDQYGTDPDMKLLKKKLKHMTRVVYDYPELRNNIGDMETINPKARGQMMSVDPTVGGRDKAIIKYNAYHDREGDEAENQRKKELEADLNLKRFNSPNYDFAGTHEMGHVLSSLLLDNGDRTQDLIDENTGKNEDSIIKEVIENKNVLTPDQKKDIQYHEKNTNYKTYPLLKGQVDTQKSKLYQNGLTSLYGSVAPVETFAEAFHDVYANGNKAKKFSIEIVKEYEKRQTNLTKKKFSKKKRGFLRRIADIFKF